MNVFIHLRDNLKRTPRWRTRLLQAQVLGGAVNPFPEMDGN